MAQSNSREFAVKKAATTIASVRSKTMTSNKTPIETTNDDDDADVSYLTGTFATKSLEISVEGLTDDDVLSDIALSNTDSDAHLSDITLVRPNGDIVSGNFILTNYVETGQYENAVTFTATLVRNGAHTFTAA